MKKLVFSAVSLDVGGIETALVTLLNYLAKQKENEEYKYEITLFLEKREGIFLNEIDKRIQIKKYSPCKLKLALIRKFINLVKQTVFKLKYKDKFDFSCAYATYSKPASFVARTASENSCLWVHLDYLAFFENNQEETKAFFCGVKESEFKHIVCISEKSMESFLKLFPEEKEKTIHINNLIDYNKILKLADEPISEEFNNTEVTTFINIGRHEEGQKRLSRLIQACQMLKEDKETNGKFRLILIGDGIDSERYKNMVNNYRLQNEIEMLGKKKNPFPYLKASDCFVLCSNYEGYPVVYVESMILNKPIITTYVSGTKEIEEEGYAEIVKPDLESIYQAMKKFIQHNRNEIKNKFNPVQYNEKIIKQLEKIF